jgi:hypothetical protein
MNFSWGTVLAGLLVALVAGPVTWFITNAILGPWVDRRKLLTAEKRKHVMQPVACHPCGGGEVPYWFASRPISFPPSETGWGTCICRYHDGLEPRVALPYEDEATYREAIKVEAKVAKTALKGKKA